jgi:hypothetical protein
MWNAMKASIEKNGGEVRVNSEVIGIHRNGKGIESVVVGCNGHTQTIPGTHFISSMPVTELIKKLDPPPPPAVLDAADKLKYRDFLTVCLIVNKPDLFPDNWIYVHDPHVKVGRIQNFKNWSLEMVPDASKTSLGLEYFCSEGDGLWNMSDAELIDLGRRELARIGLVSPEDIEDGCVFRVPKAYPIYDSEYRDYLATIREFVSDIANYQPIGRNGLHRYNNQDHAMFTGMLAVRNIMLGENNDLWNVNTDVEYLEEIRETVNLEPVIASDAVKNAFSEVFVKLDRAALGLSVGTIAGILLFLKTLILAVNGLAGTGTHMQLLDEYLPWYSVTISGSLLGLVYGSLIGFIVGWLFSFLRNVSVFLYTASLYSRAERLLLRNFLEYV